MPPEGGEGWPSLIAFECIKVLLPAVPKAGPGEYLSGTPRTFTDTPLVA